MKDKDEMFKLIEEHQVSNIPIKDFCKYHHISKKTYYKYRDIYYEEKYSDDDYGDKECIYELKTISNNDISFKVNGLSFEIDNCNDLDIIIKSLMKVL